MTAEIFQFPNRRLEPKTVAVFDDTELAQSDAQKVTTLIISDGVYSMPGAAFPFPAAAAVDPKYMAALEKQKKQRENG
jgi:hypothetical protein